MIEMEGKLDNDDEQTGRVLGRREVLGLLGIAGVGLFFGCSDNATEATPVSDNSTCAVRPELTEGPYFVDEKLDRSNITTDPATGAVSEGVPLAIIFNVSRIGSGTCTPLAGAIVDIWHCDATGKYSDVANNGTSGRKFLRGYQTTNAQGSVLFTTIYPGWYSGRAVHIHFKIRATTTGGESYEFTSQVFFDEAITSQVHALEPYASEGTRDVLNSNDNIYNDGGSRLVLATAKSGDGYSAIFNIGLQIS